MNKEENLILFPEVEKLSKRLTHAQFGEMILAVMAYVYRNEVYSGDDQIVGICYDVVINQVERGRAVSRERSKAAKSRWDKNAEECKFMQTDAPVQTSPDQSSPIQSSPAQSRDDNSEEISADIKGRVSHGAAAPARPKKKSFGKFGWVKLSREEHQALRDRLGQEELERCIAYVDESCQKTGNKNRWKDFGLVIQKCAEEGWGHPGVESRRKAVVYGASGELGEAELRNLMRVTRDMEPMDGAEHT